MTCHSHELAKAIDPFDCSHSEQQIVGYKAFVPQVSDVTGSLEHIFNAMQVAENIVQEAEREHWPFFQWQMREQIGIANIHFDEEPYLEAEMVRFQLQFVQTMERLFEQIEKYLTNDITEQKGEVSRPSEPSAREAVFHHECRSMSGEHYMKARFNPRQTFLPQIEERVAMETVRLKRRMKQSLDKNRQRNAGVTHYLWVAVGDERTRDHHAAQSGEVYSWAEGSPIGHPGEPANCRCGAIPTAEGIDREAPEKPSFEEFDVAALGGIRIIIQQILKRTGDKVVKLPKPKPKTPKPKPPQTPKVPGKKKIHVSDKQAQRKYKHAKDFGLPKNYSKRNGERFKKVIQEHVKNKDTKVINGTYRGKEVTHHYNNKTRINVIKDKDGNFVSGWKVSKEQGRILTEAGKLGGGKCISYHSRIVKKSFYSSY